MSQFRKSFVRTIFFFGIAVFLTCLGYLKAECNPSLSCPWGNWATVHTPVETKIVWTSTDFSSTARITTGGCSTPAGEYLSGWAYMKTLPWVCYGVADVLPKPYRFGDEVGASFEIRGNNKYFHSYFPRGVIFSDSDCEVCNVTVYDTGIPMFLDFINGTGCPNGTRLHYSLPNLHISTNAYSPQDPQTSSVCGKTCAIQENRFEIIVRFFETVYMGPSKTISTSMKVLLGEVTGEIIVKVNPQIEFDPFDFVPDIESGSDIASISEEHCIWDLNQSSHRNFWYNEYPPCGGIESCEGSPGILVDGFSCYSFRCGNDPSPLCTSSTINQYFCRAKNPAWRQDVSLEENYQLPDYMEGWSINPSSHTLILHLGSTEKVEVVCGHAGYQEAYYTKHMASSIDYINPQGYRSTLWTFQYDPDDPSKLISIQGQAETPAEGKVYVYDWTDDNPNDGLQSLTITYTEGENSGGVWTAFFDSEGRFVSRSGGCSSGCGGGAPVSSGLVEYHPDYPDLIQKLYNSQDDVIEWNEYATFDIDIPSEDTPEELPAIAGFENDSVTDGTMAFMIPKLWSSDSSNGIYVFNPSAGQWDTRYPEQPNPEGENVLTLTSNISNNTVLYTDRLGIIRPNTQYVLYANVGAYQDNETSQVTIRLQAIDPSNPSAPPVDVGVINAQEGSGLTEGQWIELNAGWDSEDPPSYPKPAIFRIEIEGKYVDIDNIRMIVMSTGTLHTGPLRDWTKAQKIGSNPIWLVDWAYNLDNYWAIEKRFVDDENARVLRHGYSDITFSHLLSTTEYELLNDDPNNPSGRFYTTIYSEDSVNTYRTRFPSNKKESVQEIERLGGENKSISKSKSYIRDVVSGKMVNVEEHYPMETPQRRIDARGGITLSTYTDNLLTNVQEPDDSDDGVDRQVTDYEYGGDRRITHEWRKDSNGQWIKTTYEYNETTKLLDKVIVDDDVEYGDLHGETGPRTGLKQTTEYRYDGLGRVIREKIPGNVITGKTYWIDSTLRSEFTLADPIQFDEPSPQLSSLTLYYYDADGRIEYIKRVKSNGFFDFWNPPHDPNHPCEVPNSGVSLVVTKNEYDFMGRKTKVVEDLCGSALETQYEYNYQGELTKTILPNGKWTETYRDGRGLVIIEVVGYGQGASRTEVAVAEFRYDDNKNLIEQIAPDDTRTVYKYDNLDRLISIRRGMPPQGGSQ